MKIGQKRWTRMGRSLVTLFLGLGMVPLGLTAQGGGAGQVDAPVDPSFLKGLEFRLVGPFRGGRSVAVAGDPANQLVFYFGSTGGGLWKTEDAGWTWQNISDGFFQTGSVGAVAVAPSNPDILYVGMGESCIRGNNSHGDGVYKSTDGGRTWTKMGLDATHHIARIRIHPRDPDLVYVAALGDSWGPTPDRGVYRSKDGGGTWEKVLFRDNESGAIDLSMDLTNPGVLYASLLEIQRYPWGLRSGGDGSGLFKSTDGGDTWTEITRNPGLPTGTNRGRIGVAVSPAKPQRVWAIIDAEDRQKGVYRSDDAGATWQLTSDYGSLTQRPWYYHHIFADTKDAETVYVLNTGLYRSTDGGKSWTAIPTPHGDNHDLWIDPIDPKRMVEANDGGGTVSLNGGKTWSTILNQPTAQLYHVTTDTRFPYRLYGAQQDNSTISVPSRSPFGEVTQGEWYAVGGGEAGYVAVSPEDPEIVYAADHWWLTRYDNRTKDVKWISAWPELYYGWGAADLKYRLQWTHPVLISPHDPKALYIGSQFVLKSTDEGNSWQEVSPDLTRADPDKLERAPRRGREEIEAYWGPITRDASGIEHYGTIFALAESPIQKGVWWAGSDDGLVHVSRDDGKTWQDVTPQGLPEWALVSIIDPSPHDPATAYLAATRYKLQDNRPYLYKTNDYGTSWTKITAGISDHDFTRVIREDPARRGLLYTGTETGMYVSFDDGGRWQRLQLNLPVVPVHDFVFKDGELAIATHGRSFWIFDDAYVLRQLTPEVLASATHLFAPRPTVRFLDNRRPAAGGLGSTPEPAGENPASGVVFHYYLGRRPAGEVKLAILEPSGQLLQEFTSAGTNGPKVPTEVGTNRLEWNMRYPAPFLLDGTFFMRYRPIGPKAPPGTYQARLTVDGRTYTESFEIVKDPRVSTTAEQFAEQHRMLLAARDRIGKIHETVGEVRRLRAQLEEIVRRAEGTPDEARVKRLATAAQDGLWEVEDGLIQFRARGPQDLLNYPPMLDDKLSTLGFFVEGSDLPATRQDQALFEDLSQRMDAELAKLENLKKRELAELGLVVTR